MDDSRVERNEEIAWMKFKVNPDPCSVVSGAGFRRLEPLRCSYLGLVMMYPGPDSVGRPRDNFLSGAGFPIVQFYYLS